MWIIVIGSGKGGVGRSTLTANLGAILAGMGKSTMVIDASLTSPNLSLFFKLEKVTHTLNDVLDGDAKLKEVLYDGPNGVKIAPAGLTLEKIREAKPERLPKVVKEQADGFDFVLIDAPNGLRQETVSALSAGDELLILTIPELTAISDAMKTKVASEFLDLNPLGIVLNQVQGEDYELASDEIEGIMNLPILEKIPYDKEVREALKDGELLIEYDSKSSAAKAMRKIGEKLVEMKKIREKMGES